MWCDARLEFTRYILDVARSGIGNKTRYRRFQCNSCHAKKSVGAWLARCVEFIDRTPDRRVQFCSHARLQAQSQVEPPASTPPVVSHGGSSTEVDSPSTWTQEWLSGRKRARRLLSLPAFVERIDKCRPPRPIVKRQQTGGLHRQRPAGRRNSRGF